MYGGTRSRHRERERYARSERFALSARMIVDLAAVQPCTADVRGTYRPPRFSPDQIPLALSMMERAMRSPASREEREGPAPASGRGGADAGLNPRRLREEPASSPASLTAAESAGKRAGGGAAEHASARAGSPGREAPWTTAPVGRRHRGRARQWSRSTVSVPNLEIKGDSLADNHITFLQIGATHTNSPTQYCADSPRFSLFSLLILDLLVS